MMYSSYDGATEGLHDFPRGAVMEGIVLVEGKPKGKGKTPVNFRLYMGGREPRLVTQVSEGDIARIAQLYPAKDGQGKLMGKYKPVWEMVKVKVGGPT